MRQYDRVREERYNRFLHGLDRNDVGTNMQQSPLMSDAELQTLIDELTPKIKTNTALATILTIIGFISSTFVRVGVGEFFDMLVLVVFFSMFFSFAFYFGNKAARQKKRLKCIVSNNIVRGVLTDNFELAVYAPGSHIRQSIIEHTKLIQLNWNRISGSDLVEGTYRGVRFSFSDLLLRHETGSGKNRKIVTRFKGQWLICELKKEIPWKICLRERGSDNKRTKSTIETENIEFNQKFHIQAEDPHTAFYVLTPHFMEYIMKARRRANARTFMKFDGRQIHIALHNGRDLFEPYGKKLFVANNIVTLRMQMQWDVKYITGVIDELLYNEKLFNKEE
ncbi:MAG: DUF3137 domain-containing protein [Oscillospiraceae bacterium]|jgi:hypothetical protein|nr:DUF3137 domain-containing protein [Oscillospiraceae bacterium]